MKPNNSILTELKVNYDDLYERFDGDEELMIIFFKKFPADTSYSMLKKAVEEKDFENMLIYSHKLKGLCANLGLDYLSKLNNVIVYNIRNQISFSPDEEFKDVEDEYERVINIISKF